MHFIICNWVTNPKTKRKRTTLAGSTLARLEFANSIFGSHNHDWEIIQQELTHISSYEYFICKKLQQQERQYLKNIRIGVLGMVALLALNTLTGVHPYGLSSAASIVALFAWAIYSIKLYRVDLAGIRKSETQRQLIWSSVSSRIMEETK